MSIIKLEGFDNIYCTKQFPKEWVELFGKSKRDKEKYDKWLDNRLAKLDVDVSFVSNNDPKFEHISNSDPRLYAIHGRSKNNPRVLYYIINEKNEAILLTPFLEKSKSDYDTAKRRAENRASEIK